LPKSRKRKTRRGGSASRSTRSSRNPTTRTTKKIAVVAIASLAIAGVLLAGFLFVFGGRGNSAPAPGTEVATPSGLKYVDEVVGTGQSPRPGQNVTVHYTGTLENGTKFDSSLDTGQPYTFRIGAGKVIGGLDEGVMTMKVGGKRRLIIPSSLGYGPAGSPPRIPANATLIFEVELLGVQ
jgi:peptidylprolyl isomerase